jgi:hypothetical protein
VRLWQLQWGLAYFWKPFFEPFLIKFFLGGLKFLLSVVLTNPVDVSFKLLFLQELGQTISLIFIRCRKELLNDPIRLVFELPQAILICKIVEEHKVVILS